jgi:hypothetical protein
MIFPIRNVALRGRPPSPATSTARARRVKLSEQRSNASLPKGYDIDLVALTFCPEICTCRALRCVRCAQLCKAATQAAIQAAEAHRTPYSVYILHPSCAFANGPPFTTWLGKWYQSAHRQPQELTESSDSNNRYETAQLPPRGCDVKAHSSVLATSARVPEAALDSLIRQGNLGSTNTVNPRMNRDRCTKKNRQTGALG